MESKNKTSTMKFSSYYKDLNLIKNKLSDSINCKQVLVGEDDYKTRLIKKIASGSFGEVYIGEMEKQNNLVAIKLEPQCTWIVPTLMNEGRLYRSFNKINDRFPIVYWFGYHDNRKFAAMIMELLGPSLYDLWLKCEQVFSLKCLIMVAIETLSCIHTIHSNNCIHRDISPNNFALGCGDKSNIFHLFDFGSALNIKRPVLKHNYKYNKKDIIGTPRFISTFSHLYQPSSFRDDMEALGYMWIYLFKGRLPWQSIRIKIDKTGLEQIKKLKLETSIEELCEGMPDVFCTYMKYARSLGPMEMPNHYWVQELFLNFAIKSNIFLDGQYDWEA